MEAAARSNLKPVSLELGGKSPLIIFNDADINLAIDTAKTAIFFNKVCLYMYILFLKQVWWYTLDDCVIFDNHQGEICIAGSRVFVQEGIYDEFVKKITESLKNWVVGDPFDSNVDQGPQVSFFSSS